MRRLDLLAAQVLDQGHDAQIAHAHGILDDERFDRAAAKAGKQPVGCIEADELHLARPAVVLQHAHHRERARFVRRKDAVDAERAVGGLVSREQRLGALVGAFDVGADMLIAAEDLDPGMRREAAQKTFFAPRACCRGPPRSAAGSLCPCRPAALARCSPASSPPLSLSVATKLTKSPPLRPESKITTGTPLRCALVTGATSAASSSGASAMPPTRRATAFSTSATCESRSSSRSGPRHVMSTSSSCAARRAPACTLCQNACDVPLGMTAIVSRPASDRLPQPATSAPA